MKKMILGIFIGIVVTLGGVAIAENLSASEITYNDTTVDQALNTLYQRSTYTEYSGSTTVTPSTTAQTLETNNKLLKNNITIDAIPSTFKNLSTASDFIASDLAEGKKAYNSDGELITGTASTIHQATNTFTSVDSGDITISLGFVPKKMIITNNSNQMMYIYEEAASTTKAINIASTNNVFVHEIGTGRGLRCMNIDGSNCVAGNTLSYYYKSIGTDVVFHTGTGGYTWTYFATE